jgi:hypothetical protein
VQVFTNLPPAMLAEVRTLAEADTARFHHQRAEERLEIIAASAEPDLAKALAGLARRGNGNGEMAE